jgi:hypothetical protein
VTPQLVTPRRLHDASLFPWLLDAEVEKLTAHVRASSERSEGRNPLWRYFGLTTRGAFKPEESPLEAKMDLMLYQVREIAERASSLEDAVTSSEDARARERPRTQAERYRAERDDPEWEELRTELRRNTRLELQQMASLMNIRGYYRLSKAELIDEIIGRQLSGDPRPPLSTKDGLEILESKVLSELQVIASSMGVEGYYRLRKADLIGAIIAKARGEEFKPST